MKKIDKLLKRNPKTKITKGDYVSTGSTILNLALTGSTTKGFLKGHYYRFVGDSSSGKTLLMITCFAEANKNPSFDDYNFVFDAPEDGAGFDMQKFFGASVIERIKPPRGTNDNPEYSETVEDFYDNLNDALNKGPCIYALDSMDCLATRSDLKKYAEQKTKREKQRKTGKADDGPGSFGMDKMKLNSQLLRTVMPKIRKTKSIVLVISQTRDKIGGIPGFGEQKTVGGGHALKFYTRCELWTSIKKHIYSGKVRGKEWELGIEAKVRIKKNRQTGKDWSITVPILHSCGIDDTGSCVDFLIEHEEWSKSGATINAKQLGVKKKREDLIQFIEHEDKRIKLLHNTVKQVWQDIEKETSVTRKPRYT